MNPICEKARQLLDSYLSNELQVETLHEMNEHLRGCAECRNELAWRRQSRSLLAETVRAMAPPPGYETRIQASLRGRTVRPVRWWPYALVAVAAMVAVGWLTLSQYRSARLAVDALLAWGRTDHVQCARAYAREGTPVAADMREQVGAEYASLVDAVTRESARYVVREGHRCKFQGREFVHFILERDGRLTSIVMTKKRGEGETFPKSALLAAMKADRIPVYSAGDGEMHIAGAEMARHLVFVVSETSQNESLRLMAALIPSFRAVER